jgi:cytosine/adenosine deaminase-related metal-dependent hydrolase
VGAGDLWLRDGRVPGSAVPTDIVVRGGRIDTVGVAPEGWDGPTLDARGCLVLPGLVDGHAHVDKTLWGLPWRPHSAGAGLAALIENERIGRRELPPVSERAAALFETYSAHGTTLIRTHVDVDLDNGVTAVEGVLEAAARFRDRIDVEVVAFPQSGMLIAPGTADLLDAAVEAGAALVGGIDPAGLDGDAVAHLDAIFGIADRRGCGVDVHLHDRGTLGRWQVSLIVERTRALGLQGRVTVSHAFCLCDGDPAVEPLLEQLAEQRISLATVAPGSADPLPLTRIVELGIAVCLGQDGVRDLWSPWGDADMLSRAAQLAWRAGFRRDNDIALCVEIASSRGAAALGVLDQVVAPGGRGDLVLVDASGPAEAAVAHPPRSLVIKRGVPVSGALAVG